VTLLFNFAYTFTGSDKLFLDQRPFVGAANLERLFDCADFLRPATCDEDLFASAVLNTFQGDLTIQWDLILAMTVLTALPITFVFGFLQKYITTGIATTGMKVFGCNGLEAVFMRCAVRQRRRLYLICHVDMIR